MDIAARLRGLFSETRAIADGEAAGLKLFAHGAQPDFAKGIYEMPIQRTIAGSLDDGDCFYDVGANIGFFSLIAARRVGETGKVYAFEPVHRNAAGIERSAELNGFAERLEVFEEAAFRWTGSKA